MDNLHTIPFSGVCSAQSTLALHSGIIPYDFRIRRFDVHFAAGCINLLQLSLFADVGSRGDSNNEPDGINVLRDLGQVNYVVGEGLSKSLPLFWESEGKNSSIAIYANNNDFDDHYVDAEVVIERVEGGE